MVTCKRKESSQVGGIYKIWRKCIRRGETKPELINSPSKDVCTAKQRVRKWVAQDWIQGGVTSAKSVVDVEAGVCSGVCSHKHGHRFFLSIFLLICSRKGLIHCKAHMADPRAVVPTVWVVTPLGSRIRYLHYYIS